jgi:hypothetical protein
MSACRDVNIRLVLQFATLRKQRQLIMKISVWSKQKFRVCDDVHDGVGGSEVFGVFLVSMMIVVVVDVMRFSVGLVLLVAFMVVLACWWS